MTHGGRPSDGTIPPTSEWATAVGHPTIIAAEHWLQAWGAGELGPRHWQQALLALAAGSFLYCLLSALNDGQPFHALLALGWGTGMASAMGMGVLAYRHAQRQ